MMLRPYTRSLDPQDYEFLLHAEPIRAFEVSMRVPHCRSHEHKLWENASIMQQLDELEVPSNAQIIDVGSGGMFFPPYLATIGGYPNVSLTDSMDNMNISGYIQAQRLEYNVGLPLYTLRAEEMSALPSEAWDVVMCISMIEHIAADRHDDALHEMWRLTKPNGLLFITSDYFRSNAEGDAVDASQLAESPYKDGQRTPYYKEFVLNLPNIIDVEFVGETDLDYAGDFVHNYSFVNICLRKAG